MSTHTVVTGIYGTISAMVHLTIARTYRHYIRKQSQVTETKRNSRISSFRGNPAHAGGIEIEPDSLMVGRTGRVGSASTLNSLSEVYTYRSTLGTPLEALLYRLLRAGALVWHSVRDKLPDSACGNRVHSIREYFLFIVYYG